MIRAIKRRFAIRSYFKRLSLELVRRFGFKSLYRVDHVTQAVERGRYDKAFICYAHAMFSPRDEFDAFYGPLHVKCSFDELRQIIGKRYLGGRVDFDAATVIRRVKGTSIAGGSFQTEESDLAD